MNSLVKPKIIILKINRTILYEVVILKKINFITIYFYKHLKYKYRRIHYVIRSTYNIVENNNNMCNNKYKYWHVSDYEWLNARCVDIVINNKSINNNLTDIQKIFYDNLKYLNLYGITIIPNCVDGFNISNNITKKVEIILWGSPHWAYSAEDQPKIEQIESKINKSNVHLHYYTTSYSHEGHKPFINKNYNLNFTKYISTKKYENHCEYKGGIVHFLLNKYSKKIIVITFGDNIDPLFWSGYNNDTTPYKGKLYYLYVDVDDYIPSVSHGYEHRCKKDEVGALLYIPNKYIDKYNTEEYMYSTNKQQRFKLFKLIKDFHNENKGILFLGEHICEFSKNALNYSLHN